MPRFQVCGHGIDDSASIYTQYSEDNNLSMYASLYECNAIVYFH